MKKILFAWIYKIDPLHGGVERVTSVVMDGLTSRGYICDNIICEDNDTVFYTNNEISVSNKITKGALSDYLRENFYDIIVCQDACSNTMTKTFRDNSPSSTKIITFLHFAPKHWEVLYSKRAVLSEIIMADKIKMKLWWIFRLMIHPYWYYRALRSIKKTYKENYLHCDKFVLLSDRFYPEMKKYLDISTNEKLYAIQNPLSFPTIDNISEIMKHKQKEVLIVSRLDERQKGISFALKVWKIVQKHGYNDWTLKIVGYGPAEKYLKRLVVSKSIPNVVFEGWQNPNDYYKSASIFMMTSHTEGWGMTLTESQQMGVVPIAINSYSSLQDIISDGENGTIVSQADKNEYSSSLMKLMDDNHLRKKMALAGFENCKLFSNEQILGQWELFINTL